MSLWRAVAPGDLLAAAAGAPSLLQRALAASSSSTFSTWHTPARSTSSISSQACTFSGHDQQGQQQAVCARPGCSCCRRGQCSASSSEHAASSASHSSTPSTSLLSPLITSARLTGGCSSPAALHPSLTSSTAHVSTASSLGHTRAYHSHRPTRVRHAGWFRSSCSKDAAIRQLASVEDIRAYWDYEGGSPSSGSLNPGYSRPCRLSHLNIATLLSQLVAVVTAAQRGTAQQGSDVAGASGSGIAAAAAAAGAADPQVAELVADICQHGVGRRYKLADPTTVSRTLVSLGRLGHSCKPPLLAFLAGVSARRIGEAGAPDLTYTAHALAVQQRLRGPKPQLPKPQAAAVDAWWAAAWAHMGGLIRIGRVDAKDVSRLLSAAKACGVTAPGEFLALAEAAKTLSAPTAGALPAATTGGEPKQQQQVAAA